MGEMSEILKAYSMTSDATIDPETGRVVGGGGVVGNRLGMEIDEEELKKLKNENKKIVEALPPPAQPDVVDVSTFDDPDDENAFMDALVKKINKQRT